MWEHLKQEQKEKYKTLITNFASLSEAFSQKAEVDEKNSAEDIANTSYDASVVVDENHKYLVGIKSFGLNSGDQKIAQFKKDSQSWNELLSEITFYAEISPDKESADREYYGRYEKLARKIATLRNQRIESSKALIKGFKSDSTHVEAVYHVLMPTPKGRVPQIHVGETSY